MFADECVCDKGYQAQLAEEITDICAHRGSICKYLHSNADYIAYSHANANIDNAYWWRDDAGKLQCGFIDFGGYSAAPVTTLLATGIFSAEPEVGHFLSCAPSALNHPSPAPPLATPFPFPPLAGPIGVSQAGGRNLSSIHRRLRGVGRAGVQLERIPLANGPRACPCDGRQCWSCTDGV